MQIRVLLNSNIVVGHSVSTDLRLLGINHPVANTRDTSDLPRFLNAAGGVN